MKGISGLRIPIRSGFAVYLDALIAASSLDILAQAVEVDVDELLEDVERWVEREGVMYGVGVDRAARARSTAPRD